MPTRSVGFADSLQHGPVFVCDIDPQAARVILPGNVRSVDIIDVGRDKQYIVIPYDMGMAGRANRKFAKFFGCFR